MIHRDGKPNGGHWLSYMREYVCICAYVYTEMLIFICIHTHIDVSKNLFFDKSGISNSWGKIGWLTDGIKKFALNLAGNKCRFLSY